MVYSQVVNPQVLVLPNDVNSYAAHRSSRATRGFRQLRRFAIAGAAAAALLTTFGPALYAQEARTPSGRPDLTGFYDSSTLTPLNRPAKFGDKLYMSEEEARAIEEEEAAFIAKGLEASDGDRAAPEAGGAAPVGFGEEQREDLGAGNVGGYNSFWISRGTDTFMVDGKFRTSIIYDPPNGRQPMMTPRGMKRVADEFSSFTHPNDGTAWWLDGDAPGPFDGPEDVALAERCLLGFSAGPPMLPGLYNNQKRIVVTDSHVMIQVEMVHDARVVRLVDKAEIEQAHDPENIRKWLGDSLGYWDGDTLIIRTRNFRHQTGLYGGDENLELEERFTRQDDGNLLYGFTVSDPTAWTAPYSGEYVWKASTDKVFEYACHEGNYAMGGMLRGARLLEKEKLEQLNKTDDD